MKKIRKKKIIAGIGLVCSLIAVIFTLIALAYTIGSAAIDTYKAGVFDNIMTEHRDLYGVLDIEVLIKSVFATVKYLLAGVGFMPFVIEAILFVSGTFGLSKAWKIVTAAEAGKPEKSEYKKEIDKLNKEVEERKEKSRIGWKNS